MKALKGILYSKENEKDQVYMQEWKIEQGKSYLIGRNPEKTNITISEGTISRIHAELTYSSEGKLFIEDLGSANGTFIDGEQIEAKKQTKVNLNSKINFGESKFYLMISESEPRDEPKEKVRDYDRKIRDSERKDSVSSSSSSALSENRRKKSREKEDKLSRKYKKSEEKKVDRHKDKNRDRYKRSRSKSNKNSIAKSHQKWRKSRSPVRKRSRSRSRSLNKKNKPNLENTSVDKKIPIDESKKDHHKENFRHKHKIDHDKNFIIKKSLSKEKRKNSNEEKLLEELERKKKFYEEFLKLKESETNLKLKLPKLIDKEKIKIENNSKPNLTNAFKRLEENNQLKENKSHNQGDLKNGNNNINIDRKKSVENEKRIENNYEEERRSQAYRSTWKK